MQSKIDTSLNIVRAVVLRCTQSSSDKGYRIEIAVKEENGTKLFGVLAAYGRWPNLSNTAAVKTWHTGMTGATTDFIKRRSEKTGKGYIEVTPDQSFALPDGNTANPDAPPPAGNKAVRVSVEAMYREMSNSATVGFF